MRYNKTPNMHIKKKHIEKTRGRSKRMSVSDVRNAVAQAEAGLLIYACGPDGKLHSISDLSVFSHLESGLLREKNSKEKISRDALLATCQQVEVTGKWNEQGSTCRISSSVHNHLTVGEYIGRTGDVSSPPWSVPVVVRIASQSHMDDYNSGNNRRTYENAYDDILGAFYNCFYVTSIEVADGAAILHLSECTDNMSLEKQETKTLWMSQLVQTALFVIAGFGTFFISGEIFHDIASVIGECALMSANPVQVIAALVACLSMMLVTAKLLALYQRKWHKNRHEDSVKQRQGLYGELIVMPRIQSTFYMALTGIGEEMLFRYGMLSICAAISLALGLDVVTASMSAIASSAALFSIAHAASYKKVSEFVSLFVTGVLLGMAFVLTDSVLVPIFAHATYDLLVVLSEKRRMEKNQHAYFGGLKPTALVTSVKNNDCAFIIV